MSNPNEPEMEGGMGAAWPPPGTEAAPAAEVKPEVKKPEVKREVKETVEGNTAVPEEDEEEKAPAAQPQPVGTVYELKLPDYLSIHEQTPERTALLDSFAAMAPGAGMPADFAQAAVDAVFDIGVAIPSTLDVDYATPEEVASEIEKLYGPEQARDLITRAQRFVATWPSLKNWLNETGMGNSPDVVTALAFAQSGTLRCSPTQAQARITKLTGDQKSNYYSSDSKLRLLAVAEVQILSRIAHRDVVGAEEQLNRAAKPKPFVSTAATNAAAAAAAKATSAADARTTVAKMISEKGGPLLNSGHRNHTAAVKEYHKLLALIS